MEIKYLGHSCFLVKIKNYNLIFDPFINGNPLIRKPELNSIKADYVFVSHGHGDHIGDALEIIKNNNATLISNNEIVSIYSSKYKLTKAFGFNLGGKYKFDFGTVKCVNAVHSSPMPDGSYAGNPMGFIINSDEGSFYYAGDSALTMDMKLIGDYFPVDFAFLPIGDYFTMDTDDAIIASDFIKCNKIIGMHFNTWQPISINKEESINKFNKAGKELILPEIFQTFNL